MTMESEWNMSFALKEYELLCLFHVSLRNHSAFQTGLYNIELLNIRNMLLQVYLSFISLLIHARPLRSLTLMHRERTCSRSARIIWMGRKFYNIKFENSNGKKLHI